MTFYATVGKRPVFSSESTRKFAYDSLNHKYGLDTKKTMGVAMDDIPDFESLTRLEKHDLAIEKIVKEAPIRICENEKVSGAATLGYGISHLIPATYKGKAYEGSVSHLTIDFETVLKKGVNYIKELAAEALKKHTGTEREPFAKSCVHCIECFEIWHKRYLDALKDMPGYENNYKNLLNVPFKPASNFYEAVQSIWFTFAFTRLCGNWPGIGRIDYLLGDYLKKDLAEGTMTLDEARDILSHFFIKGCEWVCGGDYGSGDAQHYQNIVLSGTAPDGSVVTNEVTYLVLDVLEEFGISDFPTTVRLGKNTEEKLLKRVAEVIRYGGGVIAVYDEDVIIESLTNYGYPLEEARSFANDGCWEVQIPGKTFFSYEPFDSLRLLQETTLNYYDGVTFDSFEDLYNAYLKDLEDMVVLVRKEWYGHFVNPEDPDKNWKWRERYPCTVVSLFEQGCIEKGLCYMEGGPIYNISSPHIGGLPDTANSLYAIKKLVFDDKKIGFAELMEVLKNNWEGNETLRQYALNKYEYFGNDSDEVDLIAADIVEKFAVMCDKQNGMCGLRFPAGISTFGRQIDWCGRRVATPFGAKKDTILAGNYSPTPGTDTKGATAIIRSYCKTDFRNTVTGAALDIKLLPSCVTGENGLNSLVALLKGFVALGGHFMQLDIADTEILKEAQEHPENYQNLSVRVSGWNARFVTLNKQWQDMIIAQVGRDFT